MKGGEEIGAGRVYRYGVTDPISWDLPTERDRESSEALERVLAEENLYETLEGSRHRAFVLTQLEAIVQEWIADVAAASGLTGEDLREATGKIFTFGSYRLGVVAPSGDIDTLCVAPHYCTRESFFDHLYEKLDKNENVKNLQPVAAAFTPIIKFAFYGVEIDLLFAKLPVQRIDPGMTNLLNDDILKHVDEKTARSLNGCRVNDMLLDLVPQRNNFRTVLRFIKHWAKIRGVYANVLGFLGGVAYALLTARICQLYPRHAPNQLIKRFFKIFSIWNWRLPVVLCQIKEYSNVPGLTNFRVWNPKLNPQDRSHIMPIITPAFPSMNSTHNVTTSTMKVIMSELRRGLRLVEQVESGQVSWHAVLEPCPFFTLYSDFIWICVVGNGEHTFKKWQGWVESKLRLLFRSLEAISMINIRPWPKTFHHSVEDAGFASLHPHPRERAHQREEAEKPEEGGPTPAAPEGDQNQEENQASSQAQSQCAQAASMGMPPPPPPPTEPEDENGDESDGMARWEFAASMFVGIEINPEDDLLRSLTAEASYNGGPPQQPIIDIRRCVGDFLTIVTQWNEMDQSGADVDLRVRTIKSEDLPPFLRPRAQEKKKGDAEGEGEGVGEGVGDPAVVGVTPKDFAREDSSLSVLKNPPSHADSPYPPLESGVPASLPGETEPESLTSPSLIPTEIPKEAQISATGSGLPAGLTTAEVEADEASATAIAGSQEKASTKHEGSDASDTDTTDVANASGEEPKLKKARIEDKLQENEQNEQKDKDAG